MYFLRSLHADKSKVAYVKTRYSSEHAVSWLSHYSVQFCIRYSPEETSLNRLKFLTRRTDMCFAVIRLRRRNVCI